MSDGHYPLKVARLPISPRPQEHVNDKIIKHVDGRFISSSVLDKKRLWMVRMMGFEPTRLLTLPPEDSASAVSPHPL